MNKTFFVTPTTGYYKYFLENFHPKGEVILIEDNWEYPKGFLKKVLHKLFMSHLPLRNLYTWKKMLFPVTLFYDKQLLHRLLEVEDGDKVVILLPNPDAMMMVRNLLPPGAALYSHLMNPIKKNMPNLDDINVIRKLQRRGIRLSTFDPDDADLYGIDFRQQFLFQPKENDLHVDEKYDFYFCGVPKDREQLILSLIGQLERKGFKCKCVMPHNPSESITTEQNIEYIKMSRCIIDINQGQQKGLTRRPLEALFFKKKLITNNTYIKTLDFYCPENVFLYKEDHFDDIERFMSCPVTEISKEITHYYTYEGWIERF